MATGLACPLSDPQRNIATPTGAIKTEAAAFTGLTFHSPVFGDSVHPSAPDKGGAS